MTAARVHLLLPGARDRARCGILAGRLPTTRDLDLVTCSACLRRRRPLHGDRCDLPVSGAAEYAMATTLVGGVRREILPCECSALIIAGIDHTCDPDDRPDGGAIWT